MSILLDEAMNIATVAGGVEVEGQNSLEQLQIEGVKSDSQLHFHCMQSF